MKGLKGFKGVGSARSAGECRGVQDKCFDYWLLTPFWFGLKGLKGLKGLRGWGVLGVQGSAGECKTNDFLRG